MKNTNSRQPRYPGAVPIIVGVTGHRNPHPEAVDDIKNALATTLTGLESLFPKSGLLMLSALAKGADRLAARAAIKLGVPVIAPLPFEDEEYEKDFEESEDLAEYRALRSDPGLGGAFFVGRTSGLRHRWSEALKTRTSDGRWTGGPHRDLQYGYLGAKILRKSQILIALWDGKPVDSLGGTYDVIKNALAGIPAVYTHNGDELEIPTDSYIVITILCPREGATSIEGAGTIKVLRQGGSPDPQECKILSFSDWLAAMRSRRTRGPKAEIRAEARATSILERYNSDRRTWWLSQPEGWRENPETVNLGLEKKDATGWHPGLRRLAARMEEADWLASKYQQKRNRHLIFVLNSGIVGVLGLNAYSFLGFIPGIAVFALVIVAGFIAYFRASVLELDERFFDYRALAECLRVQIFWKLGGIEQLASDHFATSSNGSIAWIRDLVSHEEMVGFNLSKHEACHPERLELIRKDWIDYQVGYFIKKSKALSAQATRSEFLKTLSVVFTIPFALFLVIDALVKWRGAEFLPPLASSLLQFTITTIVATSGALMGYWNKIAAAELSIQYGRAGNFFGKAKTMFARIDEVVRLRRDAEAGASSAERDARITRLSLLLDADSEKELNETICMHLASVGKFALSENADWVELQRSKEFPRPY